MRRLPIKPVSLPKDLRNQANGNLDPKILKTIPGGKMHHLAADAFNAMVDAAKKDKVELKPTSSADAYRLLSIQESGFFNRYTNKPGLGIPKQYKGKRWWLKKGYAPMATPGTSNHGWGLAVDISSINQVKLEWLLKNAATFGFSWELQNEPWHIRYVTGDTVPTAVKAWLEAKSAPKPKAVKDDAVKNDVKPAVTAKKAVEKKPAAKKTVEKKVAVKKPAVKKPAAKKPVAKKTSAKKTAK